MTTDKQPIDIHDSKAMPFGKRLQSAREAMQLERKDVAAQLRLNERIIFMMEKNRYAADIPVTFIRGYLRSYAKFLNIPDHETRKAVEHIKAKPISQQTPPPNTKPITLENKSSYYFMHIFTFLIVVTLVGLIGTWWYSQNPSTTIIASSLSNTSSKAKTNTLAAPLSAQTDTAATVANAAKTAETAKTSESSESAPPTAKIVASKSSKPTIQSDDYDDDEDD